MEEADQKDAHARAAFLAEREAHEQQLTEWKVKCFDAQYERCAQTHSSIQLLHACTMHRGPTLLSLHVFVVQPQFYLPSISCNIICCTESVYRPSLLSCLQPLTCSRLSFTAFK